MTYNILDFGALANSTAINTEAIQNAVRECAQNGGGNVLIPQGTFITGSIELLSNVTLILENGSVLKASGNAADYPPNGFYHNEMHDTTSLLWARNQTNIAIRGEGTIDVNAPAFYPEGHGKNYGVKAYEQLNKEQKKDFIFDKNEERINQPIFFESCKHVSITNVQIVRSTCWTVVFSRSSFIRINGVTIQNSLVIPNDDGIHFSACTDAIVSDCNISCADDCIAMTCITDYEGVNERITVSNCILRSRSAAIRIGHNAKNIAVSNIVIHDTNRGIGIFARNHSEIKNIVVNNIILNTRIFSAGWWGKGEAIIICAAAEDSVIDHVRVSNLSGNCENGIAIYGNNYNIRHVQLCNIDLAVSKCEDFALFGGCIDLRPYAFENNLQEPFLIYTKEVEEPRLNEVSVYRI